MPLLRGLQVYGSDGVPVVGIALGPSVDPLDASVPSSTIDGRTVWQMPLMREESLIWTVVGSGDRSIVVIGQTLSEEERAEIALAARVEAGQLVVDPSTVERWDHLETIDQHTFWLVGDVPPGAAHSASYFRDQEGRRAWATISVSPERPDDWILSRLQDPAERSREVVIDGAPGWLSNTPLFVEQGFVTAITWEIVPGTWMTVSTTGLAEADSIRIAEQVRPAGSEEWEALLEGTWSGTFIADPTEVEVARGSVEEGTWRLITREVDAEDWMTLPFAVDVTSPGRPGGGGLGATAPSTR